MASHAHSAVHGLRWPDISPQTLKVQHVSMSEALQLMQGVANVSLAARTLGATGAAAAAVGKVAAAVNGAVASNAAETSGKNSNSAVAKAAAAALAKATQGLFHIQPSFHFVLSQRSFLKFIRFDP